MQFDFGYSEEKKLGKPYDIKLLRRLYPFSKPYRVWLLSSIFLIIFITLLDLALPFLIKTAIDSYIIPQTSTSEQITQNKDSAKQLKIAITDQKIKDLVQKYKGQNLFSIKGDQAGILYATIPFDRLSRLDQKDLKILRKKDLSGLTTIFIFFLAAVVLSFSLNLFQYIMMEYAGQMIMHDLRMKLFQHIQNLSLTFFNNNPTARLVTRVTNDIQNMHELFTSVVSLVFKDLFLLAGIALVLLIMDLKLALISFTVLPFIAWAAIGFSSKARDVFRILRIKVAEINTRFSETIGGIKIIQSFTKEDNNYRNFQTLNHENFIAGMQQVNIFAVFMPVIEMIGTIVLAVVIFKGGQDVLSQNISIGTLVAFISYMKMFFRPIRDLAEKYNILQNAMASAERIFLLLDNHQKLPLAHKDFVDQKVAAASLQKISFENVSFSYIKNEPVLHNISFNIKKGHSLAVVGPTGSGKTSLAGLMIRFYDPDTGQVRLNGHKLTAISPDIIRKKIVLVMQDPFLFSGTIKENIFQQNKNITASEITAILKASNCTNFIYRLPKGLDTVLAEGGTSISSGERQLIAIARAFAANPDLIIFDEASSYMDSQTEDRIQKALANLMTGRTSIIIAHRLTTARHADRIIVLKEGRIIETGSHDQLLEQKGLYYKLNYLQSRMGIIA